MFCPACGQEALESTNFCQNCGLPLPSEVQGQQLAIVHYAGFWLRFVAILIDSILISIVVVGAEAVLGLRVLPKEGLQAGLQLGALFGEKFLIGTLIHWLYWAGMESSVYQATLGKMALGLKVTDLQGRPIDFARATARYFGKFISAIIFGIGFMMAGWTAKKQALHDIMAGTLVIKKHIAQ